MPDRNVAIIVLSKKYRGSVSIGTMGSMEPTNFEKEVLEPINLTERIKIREFHQLSVLFLQKHNIWNPSMENPNEAPAVCVP